jgi:hypothetical protein
MSTHPDDALLFRYLNAEPSPEDRKHLRTCAICRLECERFESAIASFRGSVREWSDHEYLEMPYQPVRHSASVPGGGWIMAFLLLLALTGLKIALEVNPPALPAGDERDAALLDYVGNDVARPVPSSLEPLLTLVANPDEGTGDKSR